MSKTQENTTKPAYINKTTVTCQWGDVSGSLYMDELQACILHINDRTITYTIEAFDTDGNQQRSIGYHRQSMTLPDRLLAYHTSKYVTRKDLRQRIKQEVILILFQHVWGMVSPLNTGSIAENITECIMNAIHKKHMIGS